MNGHQGINGVKSWLIALMLSAPGFAAAAGAAKVLPGKSPASAAAAADQELDELLVAGAKPLRDPRKVVAWLTRLLGQFSVDGSVDLHGKGDPADQRKVEGQSKCIAVGAEPGLQCELRIRWHQEEGSYAGALLLGGESTLDPAVMLYGVAPDGLHITYVLVDNKGTADGAWGDLINPDTLASRKPCAGIPGDCERIMRITASPDLKKVEMRVVLEIDRKKAETFTFVMNRVPAAAPAAQTR